MTTKYLHQAAPDGPVVEFSDRPLKVDGITIKPKWAISTNFRKHLRKVYAPVRGNNDADAKYVQWYAKKKGLHITDAMKHLNCYV